MMKHRKRIMAAFLAVLLMTSVLPVSALAMPNVALQSNTPKEEVVYINLNADGSVKEINIVNIFDLDEEGEIIDYGKYENVRNMTTTDAVSYQDGMVTIDAGAGKLYYEGRLGENVMPWTVSIKYFMDAKEYSADEIAGMSGRLGIKILIRQNGKCDSSFFEEYALQVNFTLDTGKAANITADGATIANIGSDKQLTYTILPNKGAEIEITADVTDFEMEGISINGIPLKMNIEVDDAKLMERIADLQEATRKLDDGTGEVFDGVAELQDGVQSDLKSGVFELKDGASKLQDGVSQLRDGGGSLQSGAADLKNGASSLDEGMNSLNDGIIQMQNALTSLNAQSGTLRSGSSDFKAALEQLQASLNNMVSVSGNNVSPELSSFVTVVDGLVSAYQKVDGGITNYTDAVAQIVAGYSRISDGAERLVTGSSSLVNGTQNLYNGTGELLSGIEEVYNGTGALTDGTGKLDEGVAELLVGTRKLYDGTGELKDGTSTFKGETAGLDTKVREKIDELLKSITGGDREIKSFASERNTEVSSVQFVIRTGKIQRKEAGQTVAEQEETSSFWQKFLKLFGYDIQK